MSRGKKKGDDNEELWEHLRRCRLGTAHTKAGATEEDEAHVTRLLIAFNKDVNGDKACGFSQLHIYVKSIKVMIL